MDKLFKKDRQGTAKKATSMRWNPKQLKGPIPNSRFLFKAHSPFAPKRNHGEYTDK